MHQATGTSCIAHIDRIEQKNLPESFRLRRCGRACTRGASTPTTPLTARTTALTTRIQTAANHPPTHKQSAFHTNKVERPQQACGTKCGRACARICGYSANTSHALMHTLCSVCRGHYSSRSAFTAHLRCDNDRWTQRSRRGGFGATMACSPAAHQQLSQQLSHDVSWAVWDSNFAALLEALHG